MPKGPKIYADDRRRWLEKYEGGSSLPSIATDARRDIRTVKKQIQLAADERERALARTQLYKEALLNHNQSLLEAVARLLDILHVPYLDRLVLTDVSPTNAHYQNLIHNTDRGIKVTLVPDKKRILEILREHLATQKGLWRALDGWTAELEEYAKGATALGKAIAADAQEATGHTVGTTGPRLTYALVEGVVRTAQEVSSGRRDPLMTKEVSIGNGQVRFEGTPIGEGIPEKELPGFVNTSVQLVNCYANSPKLSALVKLRSQLESRLPDIRRELEDFQLLGVIPGRCSICRKLGI